MTTIALPLQRLPASISLCLIGQMLYIASVQIVQNFLHLVSNTFFSWWTNNIVTIHFNTCTEDVFVSNISMDSATVTWTVPSISEQQEYYIQYGLSPELLTTTTDTITSTSNTMLYSLPLTGLNQGTNYYLQVVATFSDITLYSNIVSFRTTEPRKHY